MNGPEEGLTIWLTGPPSSGKTTLARGLGDRLRQAGYRLEVLDGDVVRSLLTKGWGSPGRDGRRPSGASASSPTC